MEKFYRSVSDSGPGDVSSATSYNLINDIVPLIGLKFNLPLALSANHPLQVCVAGSGFPANPAIFELGEMALEEGDLMFIGRAWYIGG